MKFLTFLLFSLLSWSDQINFDLLSEIKNEKTSSTTVITNFDTQRAQKVTSQESSKETWLQKKTVEFVEETAEYMRNNPLPVVTTSDRSTNTSATSSSTPTSRSKSKGVKKYYVGSKGAKGQDLYVIKCHNGRSISGVWRKSSGLWMSGSASFGHNGQSIDQLAKSYCK